MPEISRFYGIVIKMYFADHAPPHFHAEYGGMQMVVDIRTLAVLAGGLSPRATGLVMEWTAAHQGELLDRWRHAQNLEPLERIAPLP